MGFSGLNITFPCKQSVIPHLDDMSEEARALGAVNTVVLDWALSPDHAAAEVLGQQLGDLLVTLALR